MAAIFSIDTSSPTPPFRQLQDSVVAALADGRLRPGAKLPTVRALASELGLATNTVASAYRALEADGVVEGRGRAGTFVRLGDDPIQARARQVAHDAANALQRLGIDEARATELLREAYSG